MHKKYKTMVKPGRYWALSAVLIIMIAAGTALLMGTYATSNPLAGASFYVDPNSPAARQAAQWRQEGRLEDAAQMDKIASQPVATWMGDWNPDPQATANSITSAAAAAGKTSIIIAYNIPARDCGHYSAGGAGSPQGYRDWISGLARGIGTRRAVVVLEPDALPLITCLTAENQQIRYELLRYAVQTLKAQPGVVLYIDAGHSNWVPAADMSQRLINAGLGMADGFALNVSNFGYTNENAAYGDELSGLTSGKHYIIDTSRNGLGPDPGGQWCNPPGRALGHPVTTTTGKPLNDALLWLKTPGESDGPCNGGPSAGQWWPEYALGLAQRQPSTADATAPAIALTAPAAGATVSGTSVAISANATDNVGVASVDFLLNGAVIKTDTAAPYSATWDSTSVANGVYTISARAYDAAGNTALTGGVGITVSNTAPTPTPTPVSGTTVIEAEALSLVPSGSGQVQSDTSASANSRLMVWSNGTAAKSLSNISATKITIRAKGDQCNGAPIMEVRLNGLLVLSQSVQSIAWADYSAVVNLPLGNHSVEIAFTNDYLSTGVCDRNLLLDRIVFEGSSNTPTPSPTPTPTPAPAPAASTIVEAETMALTPGAGQAQAETTASGGSQLLIWSNGQSTKSLSSVTASKLTVRARGHQCSGAPMMEVKVNGAVVLTQAVTATAWADYSVAVTMPPGSYTLEIGYTNDYSSGTCDRNLLLDRIALEELSATAKAGDISGDGVVDIRDLNLVISSWGRTDKPAADINRDGKVNVYDFNTVLSGWGS